MLYLKYTLSLVYFMVSQGGTRLRHQQPWWWGTILCTNSFPSGFRRRLSISWAKPPQDQPGGGGGWGGIQKESRSLRGVKEINTTFLSTQGFWFEVVRVPRMLPSVGMLWDSSQLLLRSTWRSGAWWLLFFSLKLLHINQYLPVILCFCFCFLADFYQ